MTAIRLIPLAALLALPLAASAANGEMWEVSAKMGPMPGMPAGMSMPAQVHRVCVPQGKGYESAGQRDNKNSNCKITDVKTGGGHTSYNIACTGKDAMTGSVDIEQAGPDAYKGTMKMNGQGMNMTMAYAGKKVGPCDYVDPMAKGK